MLSVCSALSFPSILIALRCFFGCRSTLTFGSLFVKTWRLIRIFDQKTIRSRILKDSQIVRALFTWRG
jgi:hypothetical protein